MTRSRTGWFPGRIRRKTNFRVGLCQVRLRTARVFAITTFSLLLFVFNAWADMQSGPRFPLALSSENLLADVRALAAEEMEGRGVGTSGIHRAARYIADAFRGAGLGPGGESDHYLQPFSVVTGVRAGEGNRLSVASAGRENPFRLGEDFSPFGSSDNGEVTGAQVVFAGYGITAPELGYDDYARLDVRGKAVLVMTHEPRERDEKSPFRSPEAYRYTEVPYKIINARQHGARAILLVEDPLAHADGPERLIGTKGRAFGKHKGILAVNVLRPVAAALLHNAGTSLARLQGEIDADLKPKSFLLKNVRVSLTVKLVRERGRTANVVGILPGQDPDLRRESIVIGAHYDHLGFGGETSLAPSQVGKVHPGADDNASGTAVVMGLARAFAEAGGGRRTLVFAAFSGEEIGLLGSTHFVRNPPVALQKVAAMVNLDMVGRMKDRKVIVHGVDTAKEFRGLLRPVGTSLGLTLSFGGDGYGPSDHTPFYAAGRPVLFFFTGPHLDYHRPSDKAEKVRPEGLSLIARLVYRVVREIDGRDEPLTFVRAKGKPRPVGRRGRGYGPYFGSIPDFTAQEGEVDGVKLMGVRPGSPAEKAGLREGDVLVEFGGMRLHSLRDFVFVLRSKRPGDRVSVVYQRAEKTLQAEAVLKRRE